MGMVNGQKEQNCKSAQRFPLYRSFLTTTILTFQEKGVEWKKLRIYKGKPAERRGRKANGSKRKQDGRVADWISSL